MRYWLLLAILLQVSCDTSTQKAGGHPDAQDPVDSAQADITLPLDMVLPGDIKEDPDLVFQGDTPFADRISNDVHDDLLWADVTDQSPNLDSQADLAGDSLEADARDGFQADLSDAQDGTQTDAQDDGTDPTDEVEDVPLPPPCPDDTDLEGATFSGTVYFDSDGSSDSFYYQSIAPAFDAPLEGISVELQLADGTLLTRTTCPNGQFSFGNLPDGLALSRTTGPEGTFPSTANSPRRFAEAVQEGELTILTLGDSIPSYGAQPYFPDRLVDLLTPFAVIHSLNIAVPGTSTEEWLPTTNRFKQDLLPLLPAADVVIISLGGNDLNYWVGYEGGLTFDEAIELAAEFPVVMETVRTNLDVIIGAIQEVNPAADIIYIIYPNYAASTYWKELAPDYIGLISSGLNNELGKTRKHFSRPGITLVDMLGATPLIDLDACLSDPLHLSEEGTHVWARQVFLALGGLEIGANSLGAVRKTGFAPLP